MYVYPQNLGEKTPFTKSRKHDSALLYEKTSETEENAHTLRHTTTDSARRALLWLILTSPPTST